jgi:HSF-type DNA-binding
MSAAGTTGTMEQSGPVDNMYHDLAMQEEGATDDRFPSKLHEMLSAIEESGMSHIVGCRSHGRCFMIHRQKEFVKEVIPK